MQPINRNSFISLEPLLKETMLERLIKIPLLIDFVCVVEHPARKHSTLLI